MASSKSQPPSSKLKRPPLLKAGDTIALIAPAFHFDRDHFEAGRRRIEDHWKVKTVVRSDLFERDGYFAGTTQRRLAEIYNAMTSPQIKGIVGIRGGYGCASFYQSLIKKLKTLKSLQPKILVGYSDLTILLNGLYQDLGWATFHGPMIVGKPFREPESSLDLEVQSFTTSLFTTKALGKVSDPRMTTIHPGHAEAPIIGGWLSLLVATLGTPYEIKTDAKILFIVASGAALYRVDRMLTELEHAGKFKKLRGIMFGQMTDCNPHGAAYADVDVLKTIKSCLSNLSIPIVYDFPAGHGRPQMTFPLGVPVEIKAPSKGKPIVHFLESGVSQR